MDITPQVLINKKKFGTYDPKNQFETLTFNKKKLAFKKGKATNYEDLAGLNILDTSVLNTKNISSPSLRLEFQLERTEKRLKKIDKELENNQKLDLTESENNKKLRKTKERLEKEVLTYRQQYREQGVFYKITDTLIYTKQVAFKGLNSLKERVKKNAFAQAVLNRIEINRKREEVQIAKLLSKKLTNEMAKPTRKDSQEIEKILHQTNKLLLK